MASTERKILIYIYHKEFILFNTRINKELYESIRKGKKFVLKLGKYLNRLFAKDL
jgi:hypothetical protein